MDMKNADFYQYAMPTAFRRFNIRPQFQFSCNCPITNHVGKRYRLKINRQSSFSLFRPFCYCRKLMADWELAVNGEEPYKITPL
jgi:hypothetical protein